MKTLVIALVIVFLAGPVHAKNYTLKTVEDFDVIELNNGRKVHLIGIQCVSEDDKTNPYLKDICKDDLKRALQTRLSPFDKSGPVQLYLEFDVKTKDDKGHLWAYVWAKIPDDYCGVYQSPKWKFIKSFQGGCYSMINAELMKQGSVKPLFTAPNVKYRDLFEELYSQAEPANYVEWPRNFVGWHHRSNYLKDPVQFWILPEDQECTDTNECICVSAVCERRCGTRDKPVNKKSVIKYQAYQDACLKINNATRDGCEGLFTGDVPKKAQCVRGRCITVEEGI